MTKYLLLKFAQKCNRQGLIYNQMSIDIFDFTCSFRGLIESDDILSVNLNPEPSEIMSFRGRPFHMQKINTQSIGNVVNGDIQQIGPRLWVNAPLNSPHPVQLDFASMDLHSSLWMRKPQNN